MVKTHHNRYAGTKTEVRAVVMGSAVIVLCATLHT